MIPIGLHQGIKVVSFSLLLVGVSPLSYAKHYYLSPTGDDQANGSKEKPWKTCRHAASQLESGDVLELGEGEYQNDWFHLTDKHSESNPVVIRAVADGKAVVDAGYQENTLLISGDHYRFEGLVFRNGKNEVGRISGDHNEFIRCSFYDPKHDGYNACFQFTGRYNLAEDCIAAGAVSHNFITYNKSGTRMYNVYRRCFAFSQKRPGQRKSLSDYNMYGANDVTLENCIGWGGGRTTNLSIHTNQNQPTMTSKRNRVLGCLFYQGPDPFPWDRDVKRNIQGGYNQAAGENYFENVLCVGGGIENASIELFERYEDTGRDIFRNLTVMHRKSPAMDLTDSKGERPAEFVNCLFYDCESGFVGEASPDTMRYCNSYGHPQAWPKGHSAGENGNRSLDPEPVGVTIAASSPMKGAGEDGEDIGANLFYRYIDGELTDQPLWPWPMAGRIREELGIDLMAELENRVGPIYPPSKTP